MVNGCVGLVQSQSIIVKTTPHTMLFSQWIFSKLWCDEVVGGIIYFNLINSPNNNKKILIIGGEIVTVNLDWIIFFINFNAFTCVI